MVARFMPVVYHSVTPVGEIGEVGATSEQWAKIPTRRDALYDRGKRVCYLTSFHVGTDESPFRSASLVRSSVLWFFDPAGQYARSARTFRLKQCDFWFSQGRGGNS